MENDIFNKILLLVILLLVANYLSGGSIYDVVKKYFGKLTKYFEETVEGFKDNNYQEKNKDWKGRVFEGLKTCQKTTPPIVHDNDFKQVYQKNYNLKDDPNMKKLYHFLQSLITVNNNHYELTTSGRKPMNMSTNDKDGLTKFLIKSFNCGDFKFTNVVILDSLIFFENPRGKELRPFRVSADVFINKVPIGKVTLHLEMFIRLDSTFYGPFNSGFPTFTRIKLVRKDKIASPLPNEDAYDVDDNLNETENSLIPDSISFSTEENTGTEETQDTDSESD